MKTPSISSPSAVDHNDFLERLSQQFENHSSISNNVFTATNSSYTSVLHSSIRNLRFASESTPKPQVIITPEHESQIPPIILCAKQSGLEIRTRSGGHDSEGLSYVSQVPFVIIDLINLNEITVNAEEKTAWVGAGSTTGSLYYKIAEKSPVLGFPAGNYPTVGVGGQFSGGGYGPMLRKYGLASDNITDARIVDVNGKILDRKSMGEDLFWAIRGGGGASFGVITSWKVKLVDVPETVTVFSVVKTLEQNVTEIIHRWQYVAPKLDRDVYVGVYLSRVNATVRANFYSVFNGGTDRLVSLMQEIFPELGLEREDCTEMSWIQSTLYSAGKPIDRLESLLDRTQTGLKRFKAKTDYVRTHIPLSVFEEIVKMMYEPEAEKSYFYFIPYGGIMEEIEESETPFPHRGGVLYKIVALVYWEDEDEDGEAQNSDRYISWIRRYYDYMTPYVSSSPREAYLNYRDLDIGVNNVEGKTNYEHASVWGKKYFKDNFDRLVRVKTVVDPVNFFKNEQSILPLSSVSAI